MAILSVFWVTLRGVLQTVILCAAGVLLAKLGPLDPIGDRKYALGVYYLFLPIYCMLQIAQAISVDRIDSFGYLAFSFVAGCLVSLLCAAIYSKIFKVDYRCTKSFILVTTFGNATSYPELLVRSLCDSGGTFEGDPNCEYAVGYAVMGLFFLNVFAWALGPFLISRDSTVCHNERRKFFLIRKFYTSVADFMADTTFAKLDVVEKEKYRDEMSKPRNDCETESNISDRFANPTRKGVESGVLEEIGLVEFSLEIKLDSDTHPEFDSHFNSFLGKLHPLVLERICNEMPGPIEPLNISFSYILEKLAIPPIILAIVGVIIGLIDPIKDWIFSDSAQPIFMKTMINVGNIAIPVLVMLLGAKLSLGVGFGKDVNLNLKDLIGIMIIRLLIVPAIGLGFMKIVALGGILDPDEDKVLAFIAYSFWNLPPSVMVISVFLVFRYYAKEIAVIQIWTNVVAAITLTVYLVIYIETLSN